MSDGVEKIRQRMRRVRDAYYAEVKTGYSSPYLRGEYRGLLEALLAIGECPEDLQKWLDEA